MEDGTSQEVVVSEATPVKHKRTYGRKKVRYGEKDRMRAFNLWARGMKIDDVAKAIGCTQPVISKWKREDEWELKEKELRAEAISTVYGDLREYFTDREKAHLQSYQEAQTRAWEAFETLDFKNAGDAFDAMDKAIKGERTISANAVHIKFIIEVATVLRKYVSDKRLLADIARDLKVLVLNASETYQ